MTRIIFITGTGTDVGKTMVSCMLIRQLRARGRHVRAIKPVISGFDPACCEDSDSGRLLRAMDRTPDMENIRLISPWRYLDPLPPHLAAAQKGEILSLDDIAGFCRTQATDDLDFLLIEAAGGLMTPLNHRESMIDLMARMNGSCILVAGSYLGTISHCLTALSCISHHNIILDGVVISQSPDSYVDFGQVMADCADLMPGVVLRALPRDDHEAMLADLIT